MADVPPEYVDRPQAYIKHLFLDAYLERLIHKTASRYDHIAYVDGFSGPWMSAKEKFADTSFGIALKALTTARQTWASMVTKPRYVRLTAHLVEADPNAFKQLQNIGEHYPRVAVNLYPAKFLTVAKQIAVSIPSNTFSFVLVDPTGFDLDMLALRPLISREPGEVVFNFMYDFANRFVRVPALEATYNRLLPGVDWRAAICDDATATPADRKRVFLDLFKAIVRSVGGYKYVLDVDILDPGKDRTLYFLVYGTRHSSGVEVFRDCQLDALEKQSQLAGQIKLENSEARGGQYELLRSTNDMAKNSHQAFVRSEEAAARQMLSEMVAAAPLGLRWQDLWPQVLARHALRKRTLGRIVGELQKTGGLIVTPWPKGKKKPEAGYVISNPSAPN